jgi:putative flavoprotein involved in K+ transport
VVPNELQTYNGEMVHFYGECTNSSRDSNKQQMERNAANLRRTAVTITTPTAAVQSWLDRFGTALSRGDYDNAAAMFGADAYWRDLVSFTWNIKTAEGPAAIRSTLETTVPLAKPGSWKIQGHGSDATGVTEGWFTFETAVGRGRGHVRLIGDNAWTLLTTLQELKGFEEKKGERRVKGVEHGNHPGRKNWLETKTEADALLGSQQQPYVVVIGGGQGGIVLGARLKKLDVPTIIVEKNAQPGDSWRVRYKSLCLHDPVWFDHLPYIPFPDDWPVFSPKDKIADWLEMYAKVNELNYWGGTECQRAQFDETKQEWEITVQRKGATIDLRPKHLVIATGVSGVPCIPKEPGMESFRGTQIHSSQFWSAEDWRGKRAVVVGSGNSAHDICADLWEHGVDVSMIQRSPTLVARSDTLMEVALGALYSEAAVKNGISTDTADLILASLPYRILPALQVPVYQQLKERDAALYKRLEQAGFMLTFGEDDSGLLMMYLRRGSGYYVDVGASELIADGRVKLVTGEIKRITATGLEMNNGLALPADLIVYATGYDSMNASVARLLGQEVAEKIGKCWGLGSGTAKDPGPWESELRNMWKPTQQPNLWFHGGNLQQTRHYSQFLSLQLKARMEAIPTPVYDLATVYHGS